SHIRELEYRKILKCRRETKQNSEVCAFEIPPTNYDADYCTGLINCPTTKITEPPLMKQTSDDGLKKMITDVPQEIDILKLELRFLVYLGNEFLADTNVTASTPGGFSIEFHSKGIPLVLRCHLRGTHR
ncbi:hypothetical protein ILUMI_17613, partial [Ignelater luminosus]